MNIAKLIIQCIILAVLVIIGVMGNLPVRYEYKVVFLPDAVGAEFKLLNLGMEGWDMASARRAVEKKTGFDVFGTECIMKRRR